VLLTRNTKFDWLSSVLTYAGIALVIVLRRWESLRQSSIINEEARLTVGRVIIIFSSIAIWLGSMFGVLALRPNIDSFHLWIVWGVILILWIFLLEKIWKKNDKGKRLSSYER
jgi:hypothetical protein